MTKEPAARQAHSRTTPETAFGRILKSLRRRQSMSQEELGFTSGYHRTYIGQLERGEKNPSLRTIFDLATPLKERPSRIVKMVERASRWELEEQKRPKVRKR